MTLSKEQADFYVRTRDVARQQVLDLQAQIEEELARAKERLEELQRERDAARQVYEGACAMLGLPAELPETEVEAAEAD